MTRKRSSQTIWIAHSSRQALTPAVRRLSAIIVASQRWAPPVNLGAHGVGKADPRAANESRIVPTRRQPRRFCDVRRLSLPPNAFRDRPTAVGDRRLG